ncbi:MAG: 50S ribosomal protein L9 [Desulfovibrionaceae bacterium]
MKLILRSDVENLGRLGDIVVVKPGYGRNYLIPKGLAMVATEANSKVFELERRKLQQQVDSLRAAAQSDAQKIAAAKVVINVRVGEGDKLYGSVTTPMISEALVAAGAPDVDRRKIDLDEPIRSLGVHTVVVRLHPDVHVDLNVHVLREGQSLEDYMAEQTATSEAESEEATESAPDAE